MSSPPDKFKETIVKCIGIMNSISMVEAPEYLKAVDQILLQLSDCYVNQEIIRASIDVAYGILTRLGKMIGLLSSLSIEDDQLIVQLSSNMEKIRSRFKDEIAIQTGIISIMNNRMLEKSSRGDYSDRDETITMMEAIKNKAMIASKYSIEVREELDKYLAKI